MDNETKKSMYSLLNLIDFLDTMDFLNVDIEKCNNMREFIFETMKNDNMKNLSIPTSKKDRYEIIKIMPAFFKSRKIFENQKARLDFIANKLNMPNAKKWKNKTIDDISGNVIIHIMSLDEEGYDRFVKTINSFISSNELDMPTPNSKKKSSKNSFMNMWFDFFENYRK